MLELILYPDILTADPNSVDAGREYRHQRKTFENNMEECCDGARNKLRNLIKYVSTSVYEYLSDAAKY